MKLIDRYVYAVTERLPEGIREDVSKELYANIEDMLPENPTEGDVRAVLEKLGNPRKLAEDYNPTKRYLIGPGLYDSYVSVLKLVLVIVAGVMLSIIVLKWAVNPPAVSSPLQTLIRLFTDMVASVVQGLMQAALWVTMVFAIIERSSADVERMPFKNKKWSLEDLPDQPASDKRKISRGETVFSMVCTVFFTALFYFQPELIALYVKGADGITHVTPLFMGERLHFYLPVILLFCIFQLSIFIWKFISNTWSIPLAAANAVQNIMFTILVIVMISDSVLFNPEIISAIAGLTNISILRANSILSQNLRIFAAVVIALILWDSISAFVKSKK